MRNFILQKFEEIRRTENLDITQTTEFLTEELAHIPAIQPADKDSLSQLLLQTLVSDISPLSDDEKIDLVAAEVLRRFKPAFQKLAE